MTSTKIEKEALRLLLNQPLSGKYALSFLDMRKFILDGKALVAEISEYELSTGEKLISCPEGLTVLSGGIPLILYDGTVKYLPRLNFTIAHELGHIVLGHKNDGRSEQFEANKFAAELLMPSSLLYFLKCRLGNELTPNEMTKYFPASLPACRKRLLSFKFDEYTPCKEGLSLVKRIFSSEPSLSDFCETDLI